MRLSLSPDDPRLLQAIADLEAGDDESTNSSNSKPDWGPLHWFAVKQDGDPVRAQARICLGENVNAQTGVGDTALHLATWQKAHAKVRFLLEVGADPHVSNHKDQVPFHLALRKASLEIAEMLVPVTPLSPEQARMALRFWGDTLSSRTTPSSRLWEWVVSVPEADWDAAGMASKLPEPLYHALRSHRLDMALPAAAPQKVRGPRF
jgi:hypothetical protein